MVVICEAQNNADDDFICGAENKEWEDYNGTYRFTCQECGAWNEVVYDIFGR